MITGVPDGVTSETLDGSVSQGSQAVSRLTGRSRPPPLGSRANPEGRSLLMHPRVFQPPDLPEAAIPMSSSAGWTACASPCGGAVTETPTAWIPVTRRAVRG